MADGINVDELSLVIKSSAEQALEQLNKLKQGLDSIVPKLERVAFLNGKSVPKSGGIGEAVKEQVEDAKKVLDSAVRDFEDKFSKAKPRLDFSAMNQQELKKQIKKYESEIAKSKETTDRILSFGNADYESINSLMNAIYSAQKATNGLKLAQDAYNKAVAETGKRLDEIGAKQAKERKESSWYTPEDEEVERLKQLDYEAVSLGVKYNKLNDAKKQFEASGNFSDNNEYKRVSSELDDVIKKFHQVFSEREKAFGSQGNGSLYSGFDKMADDFFRFVHAYEKIELPQFNGLEELQKQLSLVDEAREKVRNSAIQLISGGLDSEDASVKKLAYDYAVLSNQYTRLINERTKLSNLEGRTQQAKKDVKPYDIEVESARELAKALIDLEARRDRLLARKEEFQFLGVKEESQKFRKLNYELERINKTIAKYNPIHEKNIGDGAFDIDTRTIDERINHTKSKFGEMIDFLKNKKILIPSDNLKDVDKKIEKVKKRYEEIQKIISARMETRQNYDLTQQFKEQQAELDRLAQEYDRLIQKQKQLSLSGGLRLSFKQIEKSLTSIQGVIKRVTRLFDKFINVIKRATKRITAFISPTKKSKKATDQFNLSNLSLVKSLTKTAKMFKLMVKRMALRAVINGLKDGFNNLVQYSDRVNESFSLLWNSMRQLNNSFAAATAPILNAFAPALNYVIQLCIKAVNAVNQLFAALTGQSTWIRATELTDDYAESLDKAGGAAKDLKKTVLGFDQLNQMQDPNSGGGGGGATTDPTAMFTEENVESRFKKVADKIKEIASSIFEPMKTAWDNVGAYVFDAWESSLNSIWETVKKVGSDFLSVWNESETIAVFENILTIVGRVGDVVSILADRFREAWGESSKGESILRNIRDIVGIVVSNFREAVDATRDWAKTLDFSALIESFESFSSSVKPVIKTISGILSDFYTDVLLPIAEWTIEEGLPDFLDMLSTLLSKIDWKKLRRELSELWEKIVPFSKEVGKGLVQFIEELGDSLATFVNDGKLSKILDKISSWLDDVSAPGVVSGINKLVDTIVGFAKAYIALKVAWLAVEGVIIAGKTASALSSVVSAFSKFFSLISKNLPILTAGINWAAILPAAGVVAGIGSFVGAIALISEHFKEIRELKELETYGQTVSGFVNSVKESISGMTDAIAESKKVRDEYASAPEVSMLEDLTNQYFKLAEKQNLTNEERKKMLDLQNLIIDKYPELADILGNETKTYKEQKDSVDKFIKSLDKKYRKMAAEDELIRLYKAEYDAIKLVDQATRNESVAKAELEAAQKALIKEQERHNRELENGTRIYEETDSALENAQKRVEDAAKNFGAMTDAVSDATKALGDVRAEIGYTTDFMLDLSSTASEAGDKLGRSFTNNIKYGMSETKMEVITTGNELIDRTYETMRSRIVDFEELGKNLARGIAEGFRKNRDIIGDVAVDAVDAAKSRVRQVNMIHSPSRLWDKEIGQMLGSGIAQGLETSSKVVKRAAESLTKYAMPKVGVVSPMPMPSVSSVHGFNGSYYNLPNMADRFDRLEGAMLYSGSSQGGSSEMVADVSISMSSSTFYRCMARAERDHNGRYKLQVEI